MLTAVIDSVRKSVQNPKPNSWKLSLLNEIGEWGRQGDVYFERIKTPHSLKGLTKVEKFDGQLAEGQQRGSRHIVTNLNAVEVFKRNQNDKHLGYVLRVKEDVEISHPDHGSVFLDKDIWVEVTYQMNWLKDAPSRVKD
jgi:hypothetical protein